jgi:hypothetical protein
VADAAGVVTGADRVDTGQRRLGLLGNKSGTTSRGFVLLLKFYEIEGGSQLPGRDPTGLR